MSEQSVDRVGEVAHVVEAVRMSLYEQWREALLGDPHTSPALPVLEEIVCAPMTAERSAVDDLRRILEAALNPLSPDA